MTKLDRWGTDLSLCKPVDDEPAHRLAWRDTPINRLTREQMIQCIEGLARDVTACRAERDEAQLEAARMIAAVRRNGCGND